MDRDPQHVLTELLVLQAQGGSEHAFAELHALWSAQLRRMAAVHVGNSGAAEDVAQDAWIAIARGLHRLDDPACFPRWAFRILARRCADWVRQRQTERHRATALTEASCDAVETHGVAGDGGEDIAALRESIARLDPTGRDLLHLFYDMEFSVAEIAAVHGVPTGTIKSRLHTLREKLRQLLEGRRP